MVARTLYVVDSEALRVTFSTTQSVGDSVINNSDSPNGSRYTFNSGFPSRAVTIEDTGGSANTLEDDRNGNHIVTNGAGLINNGNGVEAESLIQLQILDGNGTPTGPIITITVLSQNGVTSDVWGFVSDAPLIPGASYQKVGGNNIGAADYATYSTPWLSGVDGTNSADTMGPGYTDAQGDQIDGTDGLDDLIFGYGNRDSINGGLGNDTIIGGPGQDTLDGGAGIDTADYSTSTSAVTVNLATGSGSGGDAQGDVLSNFENLTGSSYNDSLTGDGTANLLIGNAGNDTLRGGAGDDTLIGGAGADLLDGGTGIDTADYANSGGAVIVNLAIGTGIGGDAQGDILSAVENITGSAFNDNLTGDSNANVLIGGGGNDTLSGGAGNDLLNGGAGTDSLLGGDGDDTLIGGAGADVLNGGNGTDTADYSASAAGVTINLATGTGTGGDAQGDTLSSIENLTGSAQSDSLTGDGNANVLSGGAGSDTLAGGGGNDTLLGGDGNDTLAGGAGADVLDGGSGTDTADYSASAAGVTINLTTGTGTGGDAQGDTLSSIENLTGSAQSDSLTGDGNANVLSGGAGSDTLAGGGGNDTLLGGDGNDTLAGGAGADVLDGGSGTDTADYSASAAGVTINLTTGTGTGGDAQGDTLSSIENLTGSAQSDSLTGDGNANVLSGGAGSDTLAGGGGNDTLLGGDGNDTLAGGAGADVLDGGSGTDTADYSASAAGVTINLTTGTGTGGDAQGDTLSSIENLTGSAQSDSLTGDGNANVLSGGAGNDTLAGGGGNDTLLGGDGNDTLIGGIGNDVLTGGAGDDLFRLADGSGADTITDFDTGDADGNGFFNDQLDLSGLTDASGNPVNVWDVVVGDDGLGNVLLSFPNGETLLLQGVTPAQINSSQQLVSAGIPCYAPGTLIDTPDGPRAVETLMPGDLVTTQDHGPQAIRWIRSADQALENVDDDAKPVRIKAGALGRNLPVRDLIVSPQHRILVGGNAQLQDVFSAEAFAPAKSLTAMPGIHTMKGKKEITWIHFACDRHEVVTANGCLSESLLLGTMVVNALDTAERQALCDIFRTVPTLDEAVNGPPARDCLTVGSSRRQVSRFLKKEGRQAAGNTRKPDLAFAKVRYERPEEFIHFAGRSGDNERYIDRLA